jgi:nuclear pore complex protein Nup93
MMVDVLAKELSDALQQPQSFRATDPKLSQLSNTEIIDFAINTMNQYEDNQHISPLIDASKKATIRTLIQLLIFRVAYEEGRYETALQLIQQTDVIPLEGSIDQLQLYANQFPGLAETIKKNIPELLLNVMDILYKMWAANKSSIEPVRVSR